MSVLPLTLTVDTAPAEAFFDDLSSLLREAPEAFNEAFFGFLDAGHEIVSLDGDCSTASGANEVSFALQPSEFMRRLMAAARAGDFDLGIFEIGHGSVSVGGLEPASEEQASAESQGPAGACPGNSHGGEQ